MARERRVKILQTNLNYWNVDNVRLLMVVIRAVGPLVVMLQEVRKEPTESELRMLKDYWVVKVVLRKSRKTGGGGVSTLMHRSVPMSAVRIIDVTDEERAEMGNWVEILVVRVDLPGKKPVTYINGYLPQEATGPNLNKLLKRVRDSGSEIMLCGDFNATCDLWEYGWRDKKVKSGDPKRKRGIKLLNTVTEGRLIPTAQESTTTGGSTLDLSFVSADLHVTDGSTVLKKFPFTGGHYPVVTALNTEGEEPGLKMVNSYRRLKGEDGHLVEKEYADKVDSILDANLMGRDLDKVGTDELIGELTGALKSGIDGIFKRFNVRSAFFKQKREGWLTDEVLDRGINKYEAEERHNSWFRERCNEASLRDHPRRVWDLIALRGDGKANCYIGEIPPGQFVSDLGRQFAFEEDPRTETVMMLQNLQRAERDVAQLFRCAVPFFSAVELLNALEEIEDDKSGGDDGLDARQVKALRQSVIGREVLLRIVNGCLSSGKHPAEYKNSVITPIEKKIPGAYRPISLLTIVDKVIQSLFINRIIPFVLPYLSEGQFGFVQGRNPELALAHLHDRALEAKKKKRACAILCLDFKGAFDRVVSPWVIAALRDHFGVPREYWRWVSDFLIDRTLQCRVDTWGGKIWSVKHKSDLGVVQGSKIGPLLWLAHVNSLLEKLETEFGTDSISTFADDINMVIEADTDEELEQKIKKACATAQSWADERAQPLNEAKSKILILKNNGKKPQATINGVPLECAKQVRILGLVWEADLRFGAHVDELLDRVRSRTRALFALGSQTWGVDQKSILVLYRSYVESVVRFGSAVWAPHCPQKEKLQTLLNSALRFCTGMHKSTNLELVHDLTRVGDINDIHFECGISLITKIAENPNCALARKIKNGESFVKNSVVGLHLHNFSQLAPGGLDSVPPRYKRCVQPQDLKHVHNASFVTGESIITNEKLEEVASDFDYVVSSDGGVELKKEGAGGLGSLMMKKPRGYVDRSKWVWCWRMSLPGGIGHSSYSAELKSAGVAFKNAEKTIGQNWWLEIPRVLAVTDSLSMIVHMRKLNPDSEEEEEFLKQLDSLCQRAKVQIRHVKSHIGVDANECADRLAEEGLKAQIQMGETKLIVKPKHLKQLAKKVTECKIEDEVKRVAHWNKNKVEDPGSKAKEAEPSLDRVERYQWYWSATRDEEGKRVKRSGACRWRQRFANQVAVGCCDAMKEDRRDFTVYRCKLCRSACGSSWRLVRHCLFRCRETAWCRAGRGRAGWEDGDGKMDEEDGLWGNNGLVRRVQAAVEGRDEGVENFLDIGEKEGFYGLE